MFLPLGKRTYLWDMTQDTDRNKTELLIQFQYITVERTMRFLRRLFLLLLRLSKLVYLTLLLTFLLIMRLGVHVYNKFNFLNYKSPSGVEGDAKAWQKLPTEQFVRDLTSCSKRTLRNMLRNRGLHPENVTKDHGGMHQMLRRYGSQCSCSICFDEYQEKDNLRILPCQHVFHKDCFDEWAKSCCEKQMCYPTCPLCNRLLC